MAGLNFNGVLKEIQERYPNIDIVDFLQDNLQISLFKAEELANRIKRQYCQQMPKTSEKDFGHQLFEPLDETAKASVFAVESLSNRELESFIQWLFGQLGYIATSDKRPLALGFDFLAEKNGEKIVLQLIKSPKNCRATDSIFSFAEDAKRFHSCERIIVLVTSCFSQQAIETAKKLGIELWDKDTLDKTILERLKNEDLGKQDWLPPYNGSLLESLLALDETGEFIIQSRAGGKYDVYLPNIKFPLLTFQAYSGALTKCVFRIRNNQPVEEAEGTALIGNDQNNIRFGPKDAEAYSLIIQYLKDFLD